MIKKLIEFKKSIKMRLNTLKNEYLLIKNSIKIVIAKIINQKNNIMNS